MLFISAVLQRYCKTLYNSNMAFVLYYHHLAPAFYMASYAISSKLHTMTMLIVRSWIVHLTPILGRSYHLHSSHHFLSTWGAVTLVTPLVERKKKKESKVMNVENSHKSACVCPMLQPFFFQAREDLLKFDTTAGYSYHSSTPVSSDRELSLRGNPLGLYRAKHLPSMKLDPR